MPTLSHIKTIILIILSYCLLILGGAFLVIYLNSLIAALAFSLIGIFWLLITSGLIGPKSLKMKIRESWIWAGTKARLVFPINPYKPIDESLREGVKDFLPTKERINNWLRLKFIGIAFSIIIVGGFFAWQYFSTQKEEVIQGETASWKTHTNTQYGFEFKYPAYFNKFKSDQGLLNLYSERTDGFQIKVYQKPLDGFTYANQSGAFSFTYSKNTGEWLPNLVGVDKALAPQIYKTKNSVLAYVVKTADGATAIEYAFIEDPAKQFVLEVSLSRNGSWRDCITPCPEEIPYSTNNTILSIIDTFRFNEIQTGIIEGSLGYPSDFIPSDMKVCAENIATKKQYCTEDHIQDNKYTYKLGYKIEAPVGDYYVFATLPKLKDYRSYYSEFVICGLSVDCLSHEPIVVAIKASSIATNIDPKDWYKPLDETANWIILRDDQFGFEMKYPPEFFQLQPKISAMSCDYVNFSSVCPVVPMAGTGRTVKRITLNDTPYCAETMNEGAAGTTYATYNYVTPRDANCLVVSFTVPYPNCQNYLPVENPSMQKNYDACKLADEVTKPETIQKILSTFRFLE